MFAPPDLGDKPSEDSIRLADWVELNLLMDEPLAACPRNTVGECLGV